MPRCRGCAASPANSRSRGDIKIRPADLYVSTDYLQPGIVLVGDAFETTCPVTGTGTDKVFTDVERLCNVHIPAWLATDGMDADKIAAFYDDPVKKACDAWSSAKAYNFRSLTIENELYWSAQRWARFLSGSGKVLRRILGPRRAAAMPVIASPPIGPKRRKTDRHGSSAETFTEVAQQLIGKPGVHVRNLSRSFLVVILIIVARRRRPDRPRCAACGSGRPRACGRRRWRRAAWRASRARSPCRRRSR